MTDLFVKLLNISITASWIVPVVILFRLILKKAPKYINVIMWALVAVRLLVPIDIESPFSLVPNAEPILQKIVMETESKAEEEPVYSEPVTENESVVTDSPIQSESAVIGDTENIGGTVSAPVFEDEPDNAPAPPVADTEASVAETPTVDSQAPAKERATYKPYVKTAATVWVCGIIAMLIYTLISCLRIRKTVSESVCLKGNIRICDRVSSPFIFGVIRPRIYMPSSLKPEDAEYVIAHEMAHIKRGDHFWKPLGFILLTLYLFNPVMWVAYILLCRDIELATDEKAINALGEEYKKPYSEALINCSMPRRMIAACPIAFGEVGVKRRIKTVLNYKKPAFWVVIIAVICCIAVAVAFLTNPKTNNDASNSGSSEEESSEESRESDEEIAQKLIGTWYGASSSSYGVTYDFNADGTGEKSYFDILSVGFAWRVDDGNIGFEYSQFDKTVDHTLSLTFESKAFSTEEYSKTEPSYGGDEYLSIDEQWSGENSNTTFTFSKDGNGSGSFNGEELVFKWKAYKTEKILLLDTEKNGIIRIRFYTSGENAFSFVFDDKIYKMAPKSVLEKNRVFEPLVCFTSIGYENREIYEGAMNYGSDSGLPLYRFDSRQELNDFKTKFNINKGTFYEETEKCNDAFFESHSLFLTYFCQGSISYDYGIDGAYISEDGKTFSLEVVPLNFPIFTEPAECDWFFVTAMPKADLENCTEFTASFKKVNSYTPNKDYTGYEISKKSYNGSPESIGHTLPMPNESKLIGFEIKGNIAHLDLSRGFVYSVGSYERGVARNQSIWSIAKTFISYFGDRGVTGVVITVNGEYTKDYDGNVMDMPLVLDENGLVTLLGVPEKNSKQ